MPLIRGSKARATRRPAKLMAEDGTYLLAENGNRILLEKYSNHQAALGLAEVVADAYDLAYTNAVTGIQETIVSKDMSGTVYQVYAYWDSSGEMAFAKRTLPSASWTIYAASPTITVSGIDSHDYISIGVDPDGYIHVAYDMHNEALLYRVSTLTIDSFIGALDTPASMLGTNESAVTYPQFIHDSTGKLYFVFRDGMAANGDAYFYTYNEGTTTWSAPTGTGTNGIIINGKGSSGVESAYMSVIRFDDSDNLHFAWSWREDTTGDPYHDLAYTMWNGTTFEQGDGTAQTIPVTTSNDDVIDAISSGNGLTWIPLLDADSSGNPHIVYFYSDSDGNRDIWHAWYSGGWVKKQITSLAGASTYKFFMIDRGNDEAIIVWANTKKQQQGLFIEESNPAGYTAWRRRKVSEEYFYLHGVFFDWQRWNDSGALEMVIVSRFRNPATWPIRFATLAI